MGMTCVPELWLTKDSTATLLLYLAASRRGCSATVIRRIQFANYNPRFMTRPAAGLGSSFTCARL